jgi:hypothetical protein
MLPAITLKPTVRDMHFDPSLLQPDAQLGGVESYETPYSEVRNPLLADEALYVPPGYAQDLRHRRHVQ